MSHKERWISVVTVRGQHNTVVKGRGKITNVVKVIRIGHTVICNHQHGTKKLQDKISLMRTGAQEKDENFWLYYDIFDSLHVS